MNEIVGNITEQKRLGRWVVNETDGGDLIIDEINKVIHFPIRMIESKSTSRRGRYAWAAPEPTVDIPFLNATFAKLVTWVNTPRKHGRFYMSKLGAGKIEWDTMRGILDKYLDNRFVVVSE